MAPTIPIAIDHTKPALYHELNFPKTNARMERNAAPLHAKAAAIAAVDAVVINIVMTGNSTAQKIAVSNTARYTRRVVRPAAASSQSATGTVSIADMSSSRRQ